VETALPYVNMGILMALAGIDFSNLREPDYNPDRFKESPDNMRYMKALVDQQLAVFRGREAVVEENRRKAGEFAVVNRSIFYDTNYFQEEQREEVRMCRDCCGFRRIASSAKQATGQRYSVFCISIPHACCPACQGEARSTYEEVKNETVYDYVYLQDRPLDEFRTFDYRTRQETVL